MADGRWGTAVAVALVAAVAGAVVAGVARRGAAPAQGVAKDLPASPVAAPEPAPPPPVDAAGARARFLAARASVSCGDASGQGAFVGPETLLASVTCPPGLAQVALADGRELAARVRAGAPPGTAILEIPGAAAPVVPTGWATELVDGARLLVTTEGGGRDTAGEAAARGLVPVDGRPLLRIEEAGGPLGGPVADERGALVGIAPSTPPDRARPWLAVPVEAFASLLGRTVPSAWTSAAEGAEDEDRRAQGDLWNRLRDRTVLLAATPAPGGPALVVARASAGRPPAETVRLAVDPPARDCSPSGRIVDWRTGPGALAGLPVPQEVASRVARLTPPPGGVAVWVGIGNARLDCDPARVAEGATLSIPGTDPPAPVPFPVGQAIPPPAEQPGPGTPAMSPADAARAAAEEAEQAAAFETGWRQAFQEANRRIAESRQRRIDIQSQRDEARSNFQVALEQQLDGDLEAARLEEKRAQEALDDLDRRASLAAVPREWRRAE